MGKYRKSSKIGGAADPFICSEYFKKFNFDTSSNKNAFKSFRHWSLRNHPDKGGEHSTFAQMSDCMDDIKTGKYVLAVASTATEPAFTTSPASAETLPSATVVFELLNSGDMDNILKTLDYASENFVIQFTNHLFSYAEIYAVNYAKKYVDEYRKTESIARREEFNFEYNFSSLSRLLSYVKTKTKSRTAWKLYANTLTAQIVSSGLQVLLRPLLEFLQLTL